MGLFSKVNGAKMGGDRDHDKPGRYWVLVDGVRQDASYNKIDFMAVDKTVIKVVGEAHEDGHKIGEEAVSLFMANSLYFDADVNNFMCAATGVGTNDVTEEDCESVCSEDQPLTGIILESKGKYRKTKKGKIIVVTRFIRAVPPTAVKESLSEEEIERFFKDGALDELIEIEAEAAVA